jgi:hypothetical protein
MTLVSASAVVGDGDLSSKDLKTKVLVQKIAMSGTFLLNVGLCPPLS